MNHVVLYIHGKGGNASESARYKPLFPGCDVTGLDYQSSTPWEAGAEIFAAVQTLKAEYAHVILIANSIGAYYSMNAEIDSLIEKAYFISPIVDMEGLIADLMMRANVTETELELKGVIPAAFGEDLSWTYLCYVREHPLEWNAPISILYGAKDDLTSRDIITAFAVRHHAKLTIMENGEHWFHTDEQMRFLENWIKGE